MPDNPPCIPIVLACIERHGQVLITRRPPGVHLAGYWEFPGGKVEPGETDTDAVAREVFEEVGARVAVYEELAVTRYHYPERCVELRLYRCALVAGEPAPREVTAVTWFPVDKLSDEMFPPANAPLLEALRTHLTQHDH